jgi:hypothetical protein
MNLTWEEVTRGFADQAIFCEGYSDLYHALYGILAQLTDTAFIGHLEKAWENRTLSNTIESSLLVPAAIHAAVLADDPAAARLRPLYESVGGRFDLSQDIPALQDGMRQLFDAGGNVMPWFLREGRIQTNETSRSVAWLIPALIFSAWQPDLSISLIDLGTSAGLNLASDHFGWQWNIDGQQFSLGDEPWLMQQTIHIEDQNDPGLLHMLPDARITPPNIFQRVGFDRFPLDVFNDDHLLGLRACIWPDQPGRMRRFEESVAGYARMVESGIMPRFFEGDIIQAAELLPKLIPADVPTPHLMLVFNSAVTVYFGDGEYERLRNNLMRSLSQLPDGVSVVWIEAEMPRYNEVAERDKHFMVKMRVPFMGGISSFFLGELEAHPTNLYVNPGWQPLREMLGLG